MQAAHVRAPAQSTRTRTPHPASWAGDVRTRMPCPASLARQVHHSHAAPGKLGQARTHSHATPCEQVCGQHSQATPCKLGERARTGTPCPASWERHVGTRTQDTRTPHAARCTRTTEAGNLEVVKQLVDQGADVNARHSTGTRALERVHLHLPICVSMRMFVCVRVFMVPHCMVWFHGSVYG